MGPAEPIMPNLTTGITKARGTRLVLLLVAALVLSATLAYQAIDAARSQRATADAVLRDYASFAAEQFAQRAGRELEFYGIYPTLQRLGAMGPEERELPTPASMRLGATPTLDHSLDLAEYFFRLDVTTGDLTLSDSPSRYPPPGFATLLASHARTVFDPQWPSAGLVLEHEDERRIFIYHRTTEDAGRTVAYGFEANGEELERWFQTALDRGPLLPTTLTGAVPNDSILLVSVEDESGRTIFPLNSAEPQHDVAYPPPGARYSLGPRFSDLTIHARLKPGMEKALVIGGLPPSRLPFTLALAILTIGLIAATILQLHRERQLATLRTQFVSNVSHELRTPLAQIRMFAETLLLGRMRSPDESNRALAIIDKEARRLTNLVENILHFSRAERQVIRIAPEPTDLSQLITEVVEQFRPLAETRDVRVLTDLETATVLVDPGAIRQILLNFLDNALKYGPEGQTVRIEADVGGSSVRVAVCDEGPGIPVAERHRIWERFSRLDRDRESVTAGTGIGLAVVRELTKLHGGRCWVEPTGLGSRFMIELPRRTVPSPLEERRTTIDRTAGAGNP